MNYISIVFAFDKDSKLKFAFKNKSRAKELICIINMNINQIITDSKQWSQLEYNQNDHRAYRGILQSDME